MAKTRRKAVKKYTLAEFKAWLEGIEEIQPDDWNPDLTQWKMIREKIAAITEKPAPPTQQPQVVQPMVPESQIPRQSAFSALPGPTALPGPAVGPPMSEPEISEAAKAALQGKIPKDIVAGTPSAGTKTPNIDTMTGNYDSNFS